MSLTQALSTTLSGLHAMQGGLSLIASNVANAQTPGYVRKSMLLATSSAGDGGSVRTVAVQRELDAFVQRQLRIESSGGAYADLRADFLQRLQQIYGEPGSDSALETVFNKFTSALQSLVTSPDSAAARSVVLSTAQVLSQSLNGMTADIQALRSDAENGLADAVATANEAMRKITMLNTQLGNANNGTLADAALFDQRDKYVDQLAQLMDIRVVQGDHNQIRVFTNSGVQLVGSEAAQLSFTPQGTVSAATLWDADPRKSNLGTLTLITSQGGSFDLISNASIRSGAIAAYLDLRDNLLVQAQNQLDSLAAAMAQALSNQTVDSSAVAVGSQSGFEVDTAGLLAGNIINLTYTDNLTGAQRRVSIVRVDDSGVLPLDNSATADPDDEVIGVNFSGGLVAVASVLNAAFGGRLQFSNPSGTLLRVLDDGATNLSNVDGLSVTRTTTVLSGAGPELPFFTDGSVPYSGAINAVGPQSRGFAGRITVNPALLLDPAKLVVFGASMAAGDPTRPDFIYQQLTGATFPFSPQAGIGTAGAPFRGTLPVFLRQILSTQGESSANATSLAEGQKVVVNALKQRMDEKSGVNVDQEMANLIALQTAYGANARVMSAIKEMLDLLVNA